MRTTMDHFNSKRFSWSIAVKSPNFTGHRRTLFSYRWVSRLEGLFELLNGRFKCQQEKGNEPCGHSAKLPAKCRFWRWVSKKQCWEQHQYAPCDAPSYIWHGAPQWDKVNHGHGTFWAAKISKWERDIDHFELGIGLILNEQVFSLGRTKQAWEGDNIFGQLIATWRPTAWNPICG